MTNTNLKHFLEISYDKLEEMNLKAKSDAEKKSPAMLEKEHVAYLKKEKGIKAVTLCFTDIEGRLHMLDYDKKFLLESLSNLTFDGSSIRGFTPQHESDLRLEVDWSSIRWMPADVFGPGKVIFFASVMNRDRSPYISDFRGQLKTYTEAMKKKDGTMAYSAGEIEGFVVAGENAEQHFDAQKGFELVSTGGYFHSLPMDTLRVFIDRAAEAHRAMGFKNEKDHPEVAPSQFEMNFSYAEVVRAADNVQLYKLVCRQVARNMGLTATFLPKPFVGINGNGMHTNFSLGKAGKNIFHDPKGKDGLSKVAWDFILRLLNHAPEICLVFNSSVNAYRRLDPHYEAPNQIKVSPIDRGSMIRIPVGNEKTARIEVRSVAPDSNPYLVLYTLLRTGLEGDKLQKDEEKRDRVRFLPDNINDAIALCKSSKFTTKILGEESKTKYIQFKQAAADRSPKALGTSVKRGEIIYHHEVTNQYLWNSF
ncbi:MAG TPA: glutamine synthetase family protein [Candidatus Paceibacterota bacterium]|nr:glutamine synthetase family protein [Candidatus Paceibacterota bacterium]